MKDKDEQELRRKLNPLPNTGWSEKNAAEAETKDGHSWRSRIIEILV